MRGAGPRRQRPTPLLRVELVIKGDPVNASSWYRGALGALCLFAALGGKAAHACPAKLAVQNSSAVQICYTNESTWDL